MFQQQPPHSCTSGNDDGAVNSSADNNSHGSDGWRAGGAWREVSIPGYHGPLLSAGCSWPVVLLVGGP
jgi:hypothetical protein